MGRWIIVLWVWTSAVAGCGAAGDPERVNDYPEMHMASGEEAPPPIAADGATLLDIACSEGAEESCNAFDDDCDGQLDEGCGFEAGDVQVTVAWNSDADVDMDVHAPEGAVGRRDHDGRGRCDPSHRHPTMENASYSSMAPGRWTVSLSVADACGHQGPTTASVSLSIGGRSYGPYNRTLDADQWEAVVSFELP